MGLYLFYIFLLSVLDLQFMTINMIQPSLCGMFTIDSLGVSRAYCFTSTSFLLRDYIITLISPKIERNKQLFLR